MTDRVSIVCTDPSHKGGKPWHIADFVREGTSWREVLAYSRIPVAASDAKVGSGVTVRAPHLEYLVGDRVATDDERRAIIVNPASVPGARKRYALPCKLCGRRPAPTESRLVAALDKCADLGVSEIPLSGFDA